MAPFCLLESKIGMTFMHKNLVICPVYNEENTLRKFYLMLRKYYYGDVLFIDDGSVDASKQILGRLTDERTFLLRYSQRRGYGATLISGFDFFRIYGYRCIVTIDVDLQHSPKHIPEFFEALNHVEIVLGSRYIRIDESLDIPRSRLLINRYIAQLLRILFGVNFTDPFCGLRGYKDTFLSKLSFNETSYGLALEILLEIIRTRTDFREIPIKAIYFQNPRVFLDDLNDPRKRLLYYLKIIEKKREIITNEEKVFSY